MKLLILSDLHYIENYPSSVRKKLILDSLEDTFDGLVLCGDNAELNHHLALFRFLRDKFSCPIGFVSGNHDLWGKSLQIPSNRLLHEIFPKMAEETGLIYLEKTNMKIGKWIIAGTYGHYDYSLARTNDIVTRKEIEEGTIIIGRKRITWMDKKYMYWGSKDDQQVCEELISDLERRIGGVTERLITISHGVPTYKLTGYPESEEEDFLAAYSGTTMIADLFQKHQISYHFCGHTHAFMQERINDTLVTNIGSGYNRLRFVVLDIDKEAVMPYSVNKGEVILNDGSR